MNEKGLLWSQAPEHLAFGGGIWGGLGEADLTEEVHSNLKTVRLVQFALFTLCL